MQELPKSYEAAKVEDAIYRQWLDSGYFDPDNLPDAASRKPYTIMLPPLNVTGTLHMGHAYEDSIQDILIRFKRMQGFKTLWLPGTDHAAIATQAKVEKDIAAKEGKSRHDLGREAFLTRVEQFAKDSHDTIVAQLKKMGASVDWSREAYTLDATRSRAVKIAFKRLFDLGVIYRGLRIVHWDPKGQTTISDDEIIREERPGKLYTFKYAHDFPIAISTSRPETKIGDTAVAVHPDDARYQTLIGREYDVGFCGTKLHIRIVADESVDPAFGTGAVGVTPAHSQTDWEIAEKNNLPHPQVIDERGRMMTDAAELHGKKITEAREIILHWLQTQNLLEKEEDILQNIALAERTKGVVEPLPKEQWFIDVNREFPLPHSDIAGIKTGEMVTLKRLMRHAVEAGLITITPEHFKKIYFHWIDNLRDWCISRQLWFGHRIPVWYDPEGGQHLPKEIAILLARHGESEANLTAADPAGDWDFEDTPLTAQGQDQSKFLADQIRDKQIKRIICSNLRRSRQTAEIIAAELNMDTSAVEVWPELQELNLDAYVQELRAQNMDPGEWVHKLYTEEHLAQFRNRVNAALNKLTHMQDGPVLVVGHNAFNALLEAAIYGTDEVNHTRSRESWDIQKNASFKELVLAADPAGHNLTQDTDTFDTWFSSGLWTFTTLGWPSDTRDLKTYHPTSVINPGYEILQLWIARMILMSTVLTGQIPFQTAFIHGLVRDKQGRKFSKSLNNGVDPLDMIAKYGTDALRMALVFTAAPGNDIAFDEDKIRGMKHFANKLWNIARFIITNLSPSVIPEATSPPKADAGYPESTGNTPNPQFAHLWGRPEPITDADRNILGKLDMVITDVTEHLENFRLHEAAQSIYQFTWHELADVYIEASKPQLQNEQTKIATEKMLFHNLITVLKLLHPFMPFITEHIAGIMTARGLRKYTTPLLISDWPKI